MATSESASGPDTGADPDEAFRYEGDPADPRFRAVVETLTSQPRPRLNRILFWSNIGVFLVGLTLAATQNGAWDFLMPIRFQGGGLVIVQTPVLERALHDT